MGATCMCPWRAVLLALLVCSSYSVPAKAQTNPDARGSRNIALVGHLPLGERPPVAGHLVLEQALDRPFAYVARPAAPTGFEVVDLSDPANPDVLHSWTVGDPAAYQDASAQEPAYFKNDGRTYLVQSFQFAPGGQTTLPAAIVFDVTGLPETFEEVARLRNPDGRGFGALFAYKHSDGRSLLFAAGGGDVMVYDAAQLLAGADAPVARIATPAQLQKGATGFDDLFVAYHTDTAQDRFYGGGAGGYHVFDVTDPAHPEHLTSISLAAVRRGAAITATPDGSYAVATAGYRTAPVRFFDLQPGLDQDIPLIRTEIGAWTANWRNYTPRLEVRWPYVFAASLEDGLHVVNMRDPNHPYTIAYYRTYEGPAGGITDTVPNGAWDVEVRNADGLIAVSDRDAGLLLFRLEAFEGWDGRGWGVPNVSSVQNWDDGPVHADRW